MSPTPDSHEALLRATLHQRTSPPADDLTRERNGCRRPHGCRRRCVRSPIGLCFVPPPGGNLSGTYPEISMARHVSAAASVEGPHTRGGDERGQWRCLICAAQDRRTIIGAQCISHFDSGGHTRPESEGPTDQRPCRTTYCVAPTMELPPRGTLRSYGQHPHTPPRNMQDIGAPLSVTLPSGDGQVPPFLTRPPRSPMGTPPAARSFLSCLSQHPTSNMTRAPSSALIYMRRGP